MQSEPEAPASSGQIALCAAEITTDDVEHVGEVVGRDLASRLGLQFSLIDDLMENLKRQQKVGVKKSLGMGNTSAMFHLTEVGRNATRRAYNARRQNAGAARPCTSLLFS